jgi:hypothetical protein
LRHKVFRDGGAGVTVQPEGFTDRIHGYLGVGFALGGSMQFQKEVPGRGFKIR